MVLTALAIFGIILVLFIFLYFVPVNLWITAIFSGVKIGLLELVFMIFEIILNSIPIYPAHLIYIWLYGIAYGKLIQ